MGLIRVPAMRVPPGKPKVTDSQESFAGGADPLGASGLVALDKVAAMTNMRLVRNGELAKRPGLRSLGTLTAGMRVYPSTLGGAYRALGMDASAAAKKISLSGTTATVTALAAMGASYSTGLGFAQFRDGSGDVLYVAAWDTGTAKGLIKWDGNATITENVGSITGLNAIWVYNQRLFGIKGTPGGNGWGGNTQTLYWSGLNDGDTIGDTASGGGSATIRTYGGQNLVGGFALGNSNYILHENAISVFRGTTFDDINITAGTSGVCPNIGFPMAWAVVDQIGYVATGEGLFIVTEGGGVRPAGTPDHPDAIRSFLLGTAEDYSRTGTTRNWFILDNARRNEVWVIVNSRNTSSGAVTARAFIWNVGLQRFTGQCVFGVAVDYATVMYDSSTAAPVMVFVRSTGVLYGTDFLLDSNNVYQDAGSSYTSSAQLRRMYTQAPSDQKSWRTAYVTMGAGAGETAATNGAATGATLSYATSGATVADTTDLKAQQVNGIQLTGQGPHIDVTITDGGSSSTGWSVVRADVEGYALGKRSG